MCGCESNATQASREYSSWRVEGTVPALILCGSPSRFNLRISDLPWRGSPGHVVADENAADGGAAARHARLPPRC
jgi:hypothetical protein